MRLSVFVIPAKAGIQELRYSLDPRLKHSGMTVIPKTETLHPQAHASGFFVPIKKMAEAFASAFSLGEKIFYARVADFFEEKFFIFHLISISSVWLNSTFTSLRSCLT